MDLDLMGPHRNDLIPRARRAAVLVALVLLAAACTDNPAVDSRAATAGLPNLLVNLSAQGWVLDPTGTTIATGDGPVTLDFHADRTVSGVAPCNAYRGTLATGDGTIEISNIAKTRRACDPAVMAAEDAYFAALAAVRDVDLSNRDRLILSAPGGARLVYDAFDPYDAVLGNWDVTSLATADALVSPPADTDVRLVFADDQTVTVDAGCGPRTGVWSLDDDQLTVSGVTGSASCADPALEAAMIAALNGTHRADLSPDSLTLLTPAGTISVMAVAEAGS